MMLQAQPTVSKRTSAGWSESEAVDLVSAGSTFRSTVDAIRELTRLPPGWDGHGSPPITREAVAVAVKVASELDNLTARVVAGVGGGLQFELRHGARELELEVLPDGSLEALLLLQGEPENEGPLNLADVPQVFAWIRCH